MYIYIIYDDSNFFWTFVDILCQWYYLDRDKRACQITVKFYHNSRKLQDDQDWKSINVRDLSALLRISSFESYSK